MINKNNTDIKPTHINSLITAYVMKTVQFQAKLKS